MTAAVLGATYRSAMSVGAAMARGIAGLPGAPARWRALGDRLGAITAE
jgi:hypothetical protein